MRRYFPPAVSVVATVAQGITGAVIRSVRGARHPTKPASAVATSWLMLADLLALCLAGELGVQTGWEPHTELPP